jgi:hypothetical protein
MDKKLKIKNILIEHGLRSDTLLLEQLSQLLTPVNEVQSVDGSWCHKFMPEGIVVRPNCTHNLENKITTHQPTKVLDVEGGKTE